MRFIGLFSIRKLLWIIMCIGFDNLLYVMLFLKKMFYQGIVFVTKGVSAVIYSNGHLKTNLVGCS